jgi:hypothetical protein
VTTIPQFRLHWRYPSGLSGCGSATYPESRAKDLAAHLNEMPKMKAMGLVYWAEAVGAAPVVRPSYKRHLKGLE